MRSIYLCYTIAPRANLHQYNENIMNIYHVTRHSVAPHAKTPPPPYHYSKLFEYYSIIRYTGTIHDYSIRRISKLFGILLLPSLVGFRYLIPRYPPSLSGLGCLTEDPGRSAPDKSKAFVVGYLRYRYDIFVTSCNNYSR